MLSGSRCAFPIYFKTMNNALMHVWYQHWLLASCSVFQEVWVLTKCFSFFSVLFCLFLLVSLENSTPLFLRLVAPFLVTFSKFQTYFHNEARKPQISGIGKNKISTCRSSSRWENALIDIFLQRFKFLAL